MQILWLHGIIFFWKLGVDPAQFSLNLVVSTSESEIEDVKFDVG